MTHLPRVALVQTGVAGTGTQIPGPRARGASPCHTVQWLFPARAREEPCGRRPPKPDSVTMAGALQAEGRITAALEEGSLCHFRCCVDGSSMLGKW